MFNSIVMVKQVPDTANITGKVMKDDGTVNRSMLPAIFNHEDKEALELALQVKERYGGTVSVITMGPPRASEMLKECLYMGADKAYLVSDRKFAGSDTLVFVINTLQLNADPPTAGWGLWELSSGEGIFDDDTLYNTVVRRMANGENRFTWTVANGEGEGLCASTSDVAIVIRSDVNRYNGFSPNGDMDNEYFIMQGLIYAEDFTFRVFSALGNTVRTVTRQDAENMEVDPSMIQGGLREDEMVVWDGRSDNGTMVPAGTYYFVISFYYADATYEYKDYVVVAYD